MKSGGSANARVGLSNAERNRYASFNCFAQIDHQLVHELALASAAGHGWDFCPVATFLGVMHDDLDLHDHLLIQGA